MTPRDRLPLSKDRLALGVEPMADELLKRPSLVEAHDGELAKLSHVVHDTVPIFGSPVVSGRPAALHPLFAEGSPLTKMARTA